ncbi:hypothetical protein X907_2020 [Glycocaulis alkaliphilus]|uniref:Uncharacterized protein n=1 Tax=Glycocaulis alkaliphilus TaxID=1434191 RepID=A0A3T0EAS5_9PROT|nr:hypothetical protein [Glycocaulis alkaliphilus]AZU04543.1 hypothetical protein X907_2020 [Glycocaulis alkaliphilus]GGB69643.1 hypothetical protein GCM10007417_06830 [Glycocaulis alkaliphilus]
MIALIAASLALTPATELNEVDLNIYCNAQAGIMTQYLADTQFAENLMMETAEWLDQAVADGRTSREYIMSVQDALFPVNQEHILADDVAALEERFAPCEEAFGG